MNIRKGKIVTLDLSNSASNTFLVDTDEGETILLTHPMASGVLIRVQRESLDLVGANLKDSTERCIDYANINKKYLDYNMVCDVEAIGMYFMVKRKLTPQLKSVLSNVCGKIAEHKFKGDIKKAMQFVTKNSALLDDFNLKWYITFKDLFSGALPITANRQRTSIFNIVGFVLAELENPTVPDSK